MAAVCATQQISERIAVNPSVRDQLMGMDAANYIDAMTRLRGLFEEEAHRPVMGVDETELQKMNIPTIVIPGNDNTHASASGHVAHRLIPGSILHELPIEDQDVPLIPFSDWAPYEAEITGVLVEFMNRVDERLA